MGVTTGKTVMKMMEKAVDAFSVENILDAVTIETPSAAELQNAGDVYWKDLPQQAKSIDGWDMTGKSGEAIVPTIPYILGEPKNDLVDYGVRDIRDPDYYIDRARVSGVRAAARLNSDVANVIANTGALFYKSATASGYEFISQARALLNERQIDTMEGSTFVLNDRDSLRFGKELASRETINNEGPNQSWQTGQLTKNGVIGGFDVRTGSFLPNVAGVAQPGTAPTVSATISHKPEGGIVNTATGVVQNNDHRLGQIPLSSAADIPVGASIYFSDGSGNIEALGNLDKTPTGIVMKFRVVAKQGNTISVFPKPIALNDSTLTDDEKAWANIDRQITAGATVSVDSPAADTKANIFFTKQSICITAGELPMDKFKKWGGMKHVAADLGNKVQYHMLWDGDIDKLSFRYRMFVWYGVTNVFPEANGVALAV